MNEIFVYPAPLGRPTDDIPIILKTWRTGARVSTLMLQPKDVVSIPVDQTQMSSFMEKSETREPFLI